MYIKKTTREDLKRRKLLTFMWSVAFWKTLESNFRAQATLSQVDGFFMEAHLGHLGINEIVFTVSLEFRIHQIYFQGFIKLRTHQVYFHRFTN